MKSRIRVLLITLTLSLPGVSMGGFGSFGLISLIGVNSADAGDVKEAKTKDIIILHSGTIVEGEILEESAGEVRIMVVVAGIKAPTTYRMSEILEIQRDIPVVTGIPGAKDPVEKDSGDGWGQRDDDEDADASGDGIPKVYQFPLKGHIVGEFGFMLNYMLNTNRRDIISYTPVEKTMNDALSYDPDVIIVEIDADAPSSIGWDGGMVAAPLMPIFEKVIEDPDVRLVFWVKNANFGAAFLPFISPEMYFESRATLGNIGMLDDFDTGDDLVNEKQISLRIGAAEGMAIKNGYDPAIIRGMARQQNWLCYRFRHGKVEFLEHEPREIDGEGWIILTDDGQGKYKDQMEIRGNDVLNLDAKTAEEIGVSKGTHDDIDDLVYALGIRGKYDLIEGRGERNFQEWRDQVQIALDRYTDLNRDIENINRDLPGGSATQKLGRERTLLGKIRSLLATYAEVLDPTEEQRAMIDIRFEEIREAIRRASMNERNRARQQINRNRNRR